MGLVVSFSLKFLPGILWLSLVAGRSWLSPSIVCLIVETPSFPISSFVCPSSSSSLACHDPSVIS